MPDAFALKLGVLKERFRDRTFGDVGELDRLAHQLVNADGNHEERERLRAIAHRLAGTAGTFGYSGITDCAVEIDEMTRVASGNSELAEAGRILAKRIREVMAF